MPHLTYEFPAEPGPGRRAFWAEVHRAMNQRLNVVINTDSLEQRRYVGRVLHDYRRKMLISCLVSERGDSVIVSFF